MPIPRSASFAAVRTHHCPSARRRRDRRRGVGADDVAGGTRGVHAHEPLAVVQARERGGADGVPPASAERLDGGGPNVRVGVPGELDQRRSRRAPDTVGAGWRPRSGRPDPSRAGAERTCGPGPGRAARARRRSSSAAVAATQRVDAGCRSPSRRRCRRACGWLRPRSADRDPRARDEATGERRGGGRAQGAERGDASPAPPIGARPPRPAHEPDQPRGAQRERVADARCCPVVPRYDRGRPRARARSSAGRASASTMIGDAKHERVHSSWSSLPTLERRPSIEGSARASGRIATMRGRAMRMRGLEPPRPYGHTDLNRARLPIPPHPRSRPILASARLTPR